MKLPHAPCRLFVYLAQTAPLGLVLRRGPSAWIQLSLWHTDTDVVETGQWFRGRVYEHRCDVSPDGSLFVYFARKDGKRSTGIEQVDSWQAISRPPWFTALALWPVGGTYGTGGFFLDGRSLYLGGRTDAPQQGQIPRWLSLAETSHYVDRTPDWTERTVFANCLLRSGWEPASDARPATWQHRHPSGSPTLLMIERSNADFRAYGGPHVVEYALRSNNGREHDLGPATWADWDQQGRLIMAREGRLLHRHADGAYREIFDFNPYLPAPAEAPGWATTWPRSPTV